MRRRARALLPSLALGASLIAAACLPVRHAPRPEEVARQEWTQTLADARVAAESGRHADADRLLATFAEQHPGTPEATETLYWRGLYRLDAANKVHTASDALQMLDAYLAAHPTDSTRFPFRPEVPVLRRVAAQTEQLGRALAAANRDAAAARAGAGAANAPKDPSVADVAAKDAEIAALKKELESKTDELERIKRRLSARRP